MRPKPNNTRAGCFVIQTRSITILVAKSTWTTQHLSVNKMTFIVGLLNYWPDIKFVMMSLHNNLTLGCRGYDVRWSSAAIKPWEIRLALESTFRCDVLASEESLGDGLVCGVGKMDAVEAQVMSTRDVGSHGEIQKFASEVAAVRARHLFVEVVSSAIPTGCLQWFCYICHQKNAQNPHYKCFSAEYTTL